MTKDTAPEISVVLPVYNEAANLDELHARLTAALTAIVPAWELIFVDDGSRDGSFEVLKLLHAKDPIHVSILRFSRNFGHHVALSAGLERARGRFTAIMDSDLQDRPEELPRLFAKILEGFDCVYGIRVSRRHSLLKRLSSRAFIAILNAMTRTDIPMTSSIFRVMSRRFVDSFNQLQERDRFVTGLMSWIGFAQTGLEVEHGARTRGETKYSLSKMLRLALDSVTSFSYRPLQMASLLGLTTAALSLVAIVVFAVRRIAWGLGVEGWTSVMVAILFLGGVQLMALE
jgi:polyisoprenyl-phosphate glycosyltransferase